MKFRWIALLCGATAALAIAMASAQQPNPNPAEPVIEPVQPEPPAVAAILETRPTTPSQCVRAAKLLADLGHVEAAKPLVKKAAEAKLTPEQLAALVEELGEPVFLDLARLPELQPEARQLADAVLAAVAAARQDTGRITAMIGQLQDPDPTKRLEALVALQSAGRAALPALLDVLADPNRSVEYQNVRTVLAGMGRTARGALEAVVVDRADPPLAAEAIRALAEMNDRGAALCMLRPCLGDQGTGTAELRAAAAAGVKQLIGAIPSRTEAAALLTKSAKAYFDRRRPIEQDAEGQAEVWVWNRQQHRCEPRRGTPDDIARLLAFRWASDAHALNPDDRDLHRFYLVAALDAAAYFEGLDKPLEDTHPVVVQCKELGPADLEKLFAFAMSSGHPAAATLAARLLGQLGEAGPLLNQGDKPSPLVLALQQPDRRLRLAAAEAIVRLKPEKPFAGSSGVLTALSYFAAGGGERRVLIGSPNTAEARDLSGMLAAAGFQTDTAATGRELLLLAVRSPDYEMAWIDLSIQRPGIALLMQELRRDPRTALLRVGIAARSGFFGEAERLASSAPMSLGFAIPRDEQAMRWQIDQLARLRPQEFVDSAARQRQAALALQLLVELADRPDNLFDLRRAQDAVLTALYNPKLTQLAVDVLKRINSVESQQALVELAGRPALPIEARRAAARGFCQNVETFGIRLTTDEIRRQYQRYNESEREEAAVQQMFGSILDGLEASKQ